MGVQRSQKGRSLQNCCCSYSALYLTSVATLLAARPPHKSAGGQAVALGERYGRQEEKNNFSCFLHFNLFLFKNRTVSFDRRRVKSDRKRWGRQAAGVGPELASLPPQIVLFFRKRNLKVYSYLLCTENHFIPTKTSFWWVLGSSGGPTARRRRTLRC